MSGGLHAKQYYQEDGLCATVIRHLRVFGPLPRSRPQAAGSVFTVQVLVG